jgi:hypothetical protein
MEETQKFCLHTLIKSFFLVCIQGKKCITLVISLKNGFFLSLHLGKKMNILLLVYFKVKYKEFGRMGQAATKSTHCLGSNQTAGDLSQLSKDDSVVVYLHGNSATRAFGHRIELYR